MTLPSDGGVTQQLPEDFAMKGQIWYCPNDGYDMVQIGIDELSVKVPSMEASRIKRVLWLGESIASVSIRVCRLARCMTDKD